MVLENDHAECQRSRDRRRDLRLDVLNGSGDRRRFLIPIYWLSGLKGMVCMEVLELVLLSQDCNECVNTFGKTWFHMIGHKRT